MMALYVEASRSPCKVLLPDIYYHSYHKKYYSLFTYFGSSNFFWFLLHNESLWRNCFVQLMCCTSTFWKCVWFENMASISKVMSVKVENVTWMFCPFFSFGIVQWRVRRIRLPILPSYSRTGSFGPSAFYALLHSLSKCWHVFCHAQGWQTNDISHAVFTQARPNGAKIMAPRWHHARAQSFPVRISETKRVKITLPCFKILTAADLSKKKKAILISFSIFRDP